MAVSDEMPSVMPSKRDTNAIEAAAPRSDASATANALPLSGAKTTPKPSPATTRPTATRS
jgi:hypothetical protein